VAFSPGNSIGSKVAIGDGGCRMVAKEQNQDRIGAMGILIRVMSESV